MLWFFLLVKRGNYNDLKTLDFFLFNNRTPSREISKTKAKLREVCFDLQPWKGFVLYNYYMLHTIQEFSFHWLFTGICSLCCNQIRNIASTLQWDLLSQLKVFVLNDGLIKQMALLNEQIYLFTLVCICHFLLDICHCRQPAFFSLALGLPSKLIHWAL